MRMLAFVVPTAIILMVVLAYVLARWRGQRIGHVNGVDDRILFQLYESRLQRACLGDQSLTLHLIQNEVQRRPYLSRIQAAKLALRRLRYSREATLNAYAQ